MTEKNSSFFDSDSKWFRPTSIATYLILVATIGCIISTGYLTYKAMYPEKVTGKASIEGEVKDSVTDEPLPSVLVSIEGTIDSTMTDEAGKYSINDTEVGIMYIIFSKPGYRTRRIRYFIDPDSATDDPFDLESIKLTLFGTHRILEPTPSGGATGTVFSHLTNSPIQGAEVKINRSSLDYNESQKQDILNDITPTFTDEDGAFSLDNLPVGRLELVVTVRFNDSFSEENWKMDSYQEIVTFFCPADTTVNIDVDVNSSTWGHLSQDLFSPYVFVNRRSLLSDWDLTLDVETPVQSSGKTVEIYIHNTNTGRLVDSKSSSGGNFTFVITQGLYDITAYCADCMITNIVNYSFSEDQNLVVPIKFGEEAKYDDEAETSGLYVCVVVNTILIIIAFMGAFYAFTRKKFFLAVIGAMACIIQQTPVFAIPSITCISINMILGLVAAFLIFRARGQFLDAVRPPQEGQGPAIEPKYEEIEEEKAPGGKEEKPRKKKR
jgi:hypothetical protein